MSRPSPSAPLLHAAVLAVGVLVGVVLARCAPFVAAQSAQPISAVPVAPADVSRTPAKAGGDEALADQLARQYARFEVIDRAFEFVSRAVSPSVVHIVTEKTGRPDDSPRVRRYEETGSGVIVRSERGDGLYVLTNHHVIEGAAPAKISIFLHDGRSLHPVRVWPDAKSDIAVLGLGRNDLPAARLGNSDEAAVGTWVLAIGSPYGLTHSVSHGIISARGRHMENDLPDVEFQDFLQTDAAINPGNSGGPLVNMRGEVIGINNSIASNSGGNDGVGFSIPINLARWIMNQLIANGRVSRGALGIELHSEFLPEDALALGLDRPRGAWVETVKDASPAALGGLRENDVILRFNGAPIADLNTLINIVSMAQIGQPAEVVIWRDRREWTLRVNVGHRDRALAEASPATASRGASGLLRRPSLPAPTSSSALGLELITLDEVTAPRLNLPNSIRGAYVSSVAPDSPLGTYVQPRDVIHSVDGRPIRTAADAVQALSRRADGSSLVLGFDRVVKGAIERLTVRVP